MAILYPEISSSGISSGGFTALSNSTANIDKQVIVYRQFPDFETNPSAIGGRPLGLPFSVVGNNTAIVRAYNNAGSIYTEQYIEGSSWAYNTLISTGLTGIRPILSLPAGGGFDLYLIKTTGYVWKYHSANGSSWSAGSQWSTIGFDNTGNLEWIAFGGGDTSLDTVYGVTKTLYGTRRIAGLTSATQYDPDIWYPFPFTGFDCQWISAYPDDTSGDKSSTDIRHVLLISSDTAPIIKYQIIGGLPVAVTQDTGGLMSCIVRPGESDRGMNSSPLYPVSITDNIAAQTRVTAHASSSSSIWGAISEHDTIWVASYGVNEDINSNDQSYSFSAIWYYCSRDGKHWSQDHMLPMDTISSTIDFSHGCTLVKYGNYIYAITCEGIVRSPGCLEFNNPGTNDQLDITKSISQYSSSTGDIKQTNITVENEQGRLNSSLLLSQVALGMITKFGSSSHKFQVSIQEIDQIQPDRERPNQAIQISARDYIARLTDRSESADAIQWDSPIVGRDTYNDIGGVANSGLSHTSVVKGSFETNASTLVVKSGYKESIEFYAADKPNVTNGFAASIFTLPNPETHTSGATATDNPTYAGVVFRAFDKDNFWSVRFNYWTQKIEIVEKKQGVNYIWYTQAPSGYFLTRATTELSVGLRVEFKGARIRVWETTQITSTGSIWSFSFEFIVHGVINPGDIIQFAGYTGQYGCGFSAVDNASASTSDDPTVTSLGVGHDGATAIAIDIGGGGGGAQQIKITSNKGVNWTNISTTGLSDSLQVAWLDPNSPYFKFGSGFLNAFFAGARGVWYGSDLLGTPNYTLNFFYPNEGAIDLKPYGPNPGEVVVSFYDHAAGGGAHAESIFRFTNYGSTTKWHAALTRSSGLIPAWIVGSGFDVNQNPGVDIVLVNAWSQSPCPSCNGANGSVNVWKITNGSVAALFHDDAANGGLHPGLVQIPFKKPDGSGNDGSYVVWTNNGAIYETTDSGVTAVNITPPFTTNDFTLSSRIVSTDDGKVMVAFAPSAFSGNCWLYYSHDGGHVWFQSSSKPGLAFNFGFFPRQLDGTYKIYCISNSQLLSISVNNLTLWEDWTGDWGANGGGWMYFAPLY